MSYNDFARVGNEASWCFAFSQRLRQLLERKGIKIAQFARLTGIPKTSIDSYLNGGSIPNYFRMMLMAEVLEMSVDKLADIRPFADLDDLDDDDESEDE